jgi:integrase
MKVTPKGRKVFLVIYRLGGAGSRLQKCTIGPYGRVTLPMARAQAPKIFAARLDGRDPAEEKKQSRRRMVVDRIDDLVEAFIQDHVSQIATSQRIAKLLHRDVIAHWGSKSIHEIKKRDVSDLLNLVAQRNAHASHRLLKTLKTFFRWCLGRAVIDSSPAEGLSSSYRQTSRDRVLGDQELAQILLPAREMPPPYGGIVEFLALTGQRREEVAQFRWSEVDERARTWTIPSSRTKNKKAHIVHLSEPAWRVIPRHSEGEFVFGTSHGKHFQNFGQAKPELDKRSGVTGWRLHDLRRTIVSGMARLGVPPHVADKILNHQAGTISGVAAVCQRQFVYLKTGETAKLQRQVLFVNAKVAGVFAQGSCRQREGVRHWVPLRQSLEAEWSANLGTCAADNCNYRQRPLVARHRRRDDRIATLLLRCRSSPFDAVDGSSTGT